MHTNSLRTEDHMVSLVCHRIENALGTQTLRFYMGDTQYSWRVLHDLLEDLSR